MARTGRPTKFNEKLGDDICKLIEMMCMPGTAARHLGITPETLANWLKASDKPGAKSEIKAWAKRYRAVDSLAQNRCITEIAQMALAKIDVIPENAALIGFKQKNLMWIAEHRWPLQLGSRAQLQIEHSELDGGPIKHEITPAEIQAKVAARFSAKVARDVTEIEPESGSGDDSQDS